MTLRAGSSVVAFASSWRAWRAVAGRCRAPRIVAHRRARGVGAGALVVWAAWMLLVRPSIRVQPDRAVVVNIGRITEVPWARIVDIRRRLQLVLDLDDGRSVECWGSPFPQAATGRAIARRPRTTTRPPRCCARHGCRGRRRTASGDWSVVRRVDVIALVIGAGAVAPPLCDLAWGGSAA